MNRLFLIIKKIECRQIVVITLFVLLHTNTLAEPQYVIKYSKLDDITIKGVVGLEEPMELCEQHIRELSVQDVIYHTNSDYIVGFRAKKKERNFPLPLFSMKTDELYANSGNVARLYLHQIVYSGAEVIVTYQVCGSGGFISVRDVFLKNFVEQ